MMVNAIIYLFVDGDGKGKGEMVLLRDINSIIRESLGERIVR